MDNKTDLVQAPEGKVWVCTACGKYTKNKYGMAKDVVGWDTSCMLSSVLCYEHKRKHPETGEPTWWVAYDENPPPVAESKAGDK